MRELLLFAYLIIALGMLFVVSHAKAVRTATLSLHAASTLLTQLVFGLSLTAGMLLLGTFTYGWLVPQYALGQTFQIVFAFGIFNVLAVGWIADKNRLQRRFHLLAAYGVITCQAAIVGLLLVQADLSIPAWVLAWLMLMGMLGVSYALFFRARARQEMLLLELSIFMMFPAALIAVSYL